MTRVLNRKLWRYNAVTGYWNYVRTVTVDTAAQWLAVFQKDELNVHFKIAYNKPAGAPK